MFAFSKALMQQKRTIALAGFCRGLLRGPVAVEVAGTTVGVAPYATGLRNRLLSPNPEQLDSAAGRRHARSSRPATPYLRRASRLISIPRSPFDSRY